MDRLNLLLATLLVTALICYAFLAAKVENLEKQNHDLRITRRNFCRQFDELKKMRLISPDLTDSENIELIKRADQKFAKFQKYDY